MSGKVRIIVIGAGLVGHRHVRHVVKEPRCKLAAVVDSDPQKKALADEAGVPFYTEVEQAFGEVRADAAIIATPNQTHTTIGIRCLEEGLHILVEKPIDADPAAARRLIETAGRHRLGLLVGHHRRFNPYVQATRRILEEGSLGRIEAVNVLWTLLKPEEYFRAAAWRCEPGGGPVLINFIHDIDNLRYFFGDIHRIFAESSSAARGLAVEDTAVVAFRFASGLLGSALISDTVASPYSFEATTGENPLVFHTGQDCYRIFGSRGVLSFPDMTLWSYRGKEQGWGRPVFSETIEVSQFAPLDEQLRHFCDVVEKGTPPRCSGEDALKTLEATLAIGESARLGLPVNLH
jgi:predicted dehydrogenase